MGPIKEIPRLTHEAKATTRAEKKKKFFSFFWRRFDDALPASVASIALGLARFRPLQSVSLCRRKFLSRKLKDYFEK